MIVPRILISLVAVTFYFTHESNSLPTFSDKFGLNALKKICSASCTAPACFTQFPGDCHRYVHCYKTTPEQEYSMAFLRTCPLGQVWEQMMMTCLPQEHPAASCEDRCSVDTTLTSYRHGDFCGQFYICANGTSMPTCCGEDEAFVEGNIKCGSNVPPQCETEKCPKAYAPIETTTASSENVTTSQLPETTTVCTKSAVAGNPVLYRIDDLNTNAECARGTIFDENECQCVFDPTYIPTTDCYPEILIRYNADKVPKNEVKQDTEVRIMNGVGLFDSKDKSSTMIAHYNGNGNLLRHFNLTIIFKSVSTEQRRQFLITNCRSTETDRPSIGILVSNVDGMLHFVADANATASDESAVKMKLNFKKGSWNWVRYIFDGRTLEAMVIPLPEVQTDPSTITEVYTNNVTLAAPSDDPVVLLPSQNPLTIGYCNHHGYDGRVYMADLAPWVCSRYVDSIKGI